MSTHWLCWALGAAVSGRAARLLEYLANLADRHGYGEVSVAKVSARLGVQASVVHRLMRLLDEQQLVEHAVIVPKAWPDPRHKRLRYRLRGGRGTEVGRETGHGDRRG